MSPRLPAMLLSSQSDDRLVSLARAGHERAFVAIVERYRPELQAMARRLCSDGRSEDVVQQAFLSAFAALRSGAEVRHLRGWLYQIVRNAAVRPPAPPCVPLDLATVSADSLEEVVQQRALARTALSELARLPARQRQAMIGTALDGRARAEIASSMGLSEGAVRQLVHRARATLRGAVTGLTPWPLARWLAAAGPDAPGPAELAAGAGVASSGGLALKLSALLASGTLLTGAAVHLQSTAPHPSSTRAAIAHHTRGGARAAVLEVVAPGGLAAVASSRATSSGAASSRQRTLAPAGGTAARRVSLGSGRHQTSTGRSGGRDGGQPGALREGGGGPSRGGPDGGTRQDGGVRQDGGTRQGGGPGEDGNGGSSTSTSGSDGPGSQNTQASGTSSDGGDHGGALTGGSQSTDGNAQMASDSRLLDSVSGGSGSGHDNGSSGGSSSGDGSGSSVGSVSGSSSGDGSGVDGGSSGG